MLQTSRLIPGILLYVLAKNGADVVDFADTLHGRTGLHIAAQAAHLDVVHCRGWPMT